MITKIHHIGMVIHNLEEALGFYRDVLGLSVHKTATVPDQGVKAALLIFPPEADSPTARGGSEVELLEPIETGTGVARFLERRGEGLHHICFQTDDIERELAGVKARGVELIDQAPRQGLAGLICFLHPRAHHGVLVELAQPTEERGTGNEERGEGRRAAFHVPGPTTPFKRLDRVIIASRDAEGAARTWERNLALRAEPAFQPPASHLRLVKLPVGDSAVELAQPLIADHRVTRFIEERGEGLFSIAIEVEDLDGVVAHLRSRGARVSRIEERPWEKTRVARINRQSAHGVSIQLVERL